MASCMKGDVLISFSQVGRVRFSPGELNKGTLTVRQAEEQGPLRQAGMCD